MTDPVFDQYKMIEDFHFTSVEQFEAFEDPLRFEMIRMLGQRPLTGAQLARNLGLTRHRVYYHLNLLEKHGLILQVGEKTRKGIVEKYYRSAARIYHDDEYVKSLRQANENTEEARRTTRALRLLLAAQMKSVSKAIENIDSEAEMDSLSYNWDYTANLTPEQAEAVSRLMGQVLNEVKKMDNPGPKPGEPSPFFSYRGICLLVRTKEATIE